MNAFSDFEAKVPPRSDWLRCWSALDPVALQKAVSALTAQCVVVDVRIPRSGLALMQMRDSAMGECFYIGEIPWSRAHVEVTDVSGANAQGAAELMHEQSSLVRSLAILDAVLSKRLLGWEDALDLLLQGHAVCEVRDARRRQLIEATRVDFQRLDVNAGEQDD